MALKDLIDVTDITPTSFCVLLFLMSEEYNKNHGDGIIFAIHNIYIGAVWLLSRKMIINIYN
ncbi:ATP synthase gamma chain [Glaciecola sp. KUL10]|nr:ATP synthase gamma chain [Glaciecola sp. KUL10]